MRLKSLDLAEIANHLLDIGLLGHFFPLQKRPKLTFKPDSVQGEGSISSKIFLPKAFQVQDNHEKASEINMDEIFGTHDP
ncbi:MAG: hypothetical protein P9M14_05625, partial [Candidatus Alcyoniella australis]|nr:hypothetical protein [Candidatus Alcyoniella australis]